MDFPDHEASAIRGTFQPAACGKKRTLPEQRWTGSYQIPSAYTWIPLGKKSTDLSDKGNTLIVDRLDHVNLGFDGIVTHGLFDNIPWVFKPLGGLGWGCSSPPFIQRSQKPHFLPLSYTKPLHLDGSLRPELLLLLTLPFWQLWCPSTLWLIASHRGPQHSIPPFTNGTI